MHLNGLLSEGNKEGKMVLTTANNQCCGFMSDGNEMKKFYSATSIPLQMNKINYRLYAHCTLGVGQHGC